MVQHDPILFDAVLRPNPPMNSKVLGCVLLAVAGMNVTFATFFILRGAWPIAPFMGLDIALLGWAFHASRLAARAFERVTVTPSELHVLCHTPDGPGDEVSFNPYWVRVTLSGKQDIPRQLILSSHGKSFQVGKFLGPRERLNLAQALKAALGSARAWRPA